MEVKALVTGSEGYVGKNLVSFLSSKDVNVKKLDINLGTDVTNKLDVQKAMRGSEIVYNCAAISGIKRCEREKDRAYMVNVVGAETVLEVAEEYNVKPVMFSSIAAIDERNISYYGTLKRQLEELAKNRAVVFRMTNVYGGLHYEKKDHVVLWHFMRDNPIYVYGGLQTRDFLHIDDVLSKCLEAVDLPYGIYDLAGNLQIPILTLARMFAAVRGVPIRIVPENFRVCTVCGKPKDSGVTLHGKFVCIDCTTACSIVNKCGQMEVAQNR